jgi:hypothetical protein
MKKIIFFLILLIFATVLKAQEHYSLIDTTKIWSYCIGSFGLGSYNIYTRCWKMSGQSDFNGHRYFKLYSSFNDSTYTNWKFDGDYIREDSGKVYWFCNNYEELIYDFNLQVGDSIPLYISIYHVKNVDSLLIDNYYRKRILLESEFGTDTWIESIGSIYSLLCTGGGNIGRCAMSIYMLCVSDLKNHILIYQPKPGKCYLSNQTGVNQETDINNKFIISSSVVTDYLNIESQVKSYSLKVIDMNGKTLLNSLYNKSASVNCSSLEPGIYLVLIQSGSKLFASKFLKQ